MVLFFASSFFIWLFSVLRVTCACSFVCVSVFCGSFLCFFFLVLSYKIKIVYYI